jgi:zinc protease
MKLLTRALRLPLIASPVIAGILLGLSPVIAGQAPPAPTPSAAAPVIDPASAIASRDAWLYKGSDIAPDPAWHFGTLKNGLRYAIRRNGVPPGQISVRVRIDAGSLYETDAERGFAHLIEHLSFRGSKYVPDGEAKRIWQRMGTTFGSDTNAQTTTTQTVFKLDLPSATPAGIDESLKIMSGMVSAPNITPEALNAERPAVLAEQREQPGAQVRYIDALNHTLFAGQPLADRSPIGNIKTLEAATAASVKAFHDRWYRPSRVMISIAGDARRPPIPISASPTPSSRPPPPSSSRACRRASRSPWCGRGSSMTIRCCSTSSAWSIRSRSRSSTAGWRRARVPAAAISPRRPDSTIRHAPPT